MNFFNNDCGHGCEGRGGCDCCTLIILILLLQCLCGGNGGCGIDCCTLILLLLICGGCGNGCGSRC